MPTDDTKNTKIKVRSINVTHRQQQRQKSVIFVLSVDKKIKSTDFADFADVAKQESVIFVLSVGKK